MPVIVFDIRSSLWINAVSYSSDIAALWTMWPEDSGAKGNATSFEHLMAQQNSFLRPSEHMWGISDRHAKNALLVDCRTLLSTSSTPNHPTRTSSYVDHSYSINRLHCFNII